jgi:rhamnulose-1-phosphate aldolase/alcohol dehydrogenase
MAVREKSGLVEPLWDAAKAPADPVDQLVYASNLLGADPRVTNFGGGNTSSKVSMADPITGEQTDVLWVKGSGGDLGSAKKAGFASLYLDKVLGLERRFHVEHLHEDEIVPLYMRCVFDSNPAAPSIDTPLHAFVPSRCVSHMHADSVIAIAASADVRSLTGEVFGKRMGFLPWKRPGFELGLMLRDLIVAEPNIDSAMMAAHGFICWADTWEKCYAVTLEIINQAVEFIEHKRNGRCVFGSAVVGRSEGVLVELLPRLRGKVAFEGQRLIAAVDTSEEAVEFSSSEAAPRLAGLGTSCPDHFLRTKIRPLMLSVGDDLDAKLADFRDQYKAYYDRCKRADSPAMRNPNPSVVIVPGVGLVSFGKNKHEATITGRFYRNAIEVMRGAETVSKYVALPEQEAFDIEYWQLEEAKLRRQPPEKDLSRQVAVITGGAQGIGKATALKMAANGAHIALLDINEERLEEARAEVQAVSGIAGAVIGVPCDVTESVSLKAAFEAAILAFGGVDLLVVNAGNARRGSVADTSPEDYKLLDSLLIKGYFDTMATGIRVMRDQGTGGSVVVVGSKNGTAAGSNAALYSAAKAFELHLARCTALDFAKDGIRCNAVNPDGVVTGSGIWSEAWKEQTAKSLGIKPDELVDYYKKRTLLGVEVWPEHVAEAIYWLSNEKCASRTTGCTITVDGGNKEGFVR